jgi:uncharacterized caspase-like protein
VVIGIDQYQHWPHLQAAVSDARAVAEALEATGFDQIIFLSNGEATRRRILTEIGTNLSRLVGPNDRVVIYFAGHGYTEELPTKEQTGYLIPVDAPKSNFFADAISMQQIRETFSRMQAKHIYYIMDSCFSGHGFTRSAGVSAEIQDYLKVVTEKRAVQMITAGRKGDLAHEQGRHGIFTLFVLRGLKGEADLNGDGVVTASELGSFVQPNVFSGSNRKQLPQYGRLEGEGEIVFLTGTETPPQKPQETREAMTALARDMARLQDQLKQQEEKRTHFEQDLSARDRQIKELQERMKATLEEMGAMKAALAAKPAPATEPPVPPPVGKAPATPTPPPPPAAPEKDPAPAPSPSASAARMPPPSASPQAQMAYAPSVAPAALSPAARFVDNGDGTVTDRRTGLMWQQAGSEDNLEIRDARDYIMGLNRSGLGGHRDWRMPTADELKTLILDEIVDTMRVDAAFDRKIRSSWSSTVAGQTSFGRSHTVVFFKDGTTLARFSVTENPMARINRPVSQHQIRAVRGQIR